MKIRSSFVTNSSSSSFVVDLNGVKDYCYDLAIKLIKEDIPLEMKSEEISKYLWSEKYIYSDEKLKCIEKWDLDNKIVHIFDDNDIATAFANPLILLLKGLGAKINHPARYFQDEDWFDHCKKIDKEWKEKYENQN